MRSRLWLPGTTRLALRASVREAFGGKSNLITTGMSVTIPLREAGEQAVGLELALAQNGFAHRENRIQTEFSCCRLDIARPPVNRPAVPLLQ